MVYVHRQVGEGVMERAAHPLAQLDAAHGEGLVRPLEMCIRDRGSSAAVVFPAVNTHPGAVPTGLRNTVHPAGR